MVNYEKPVEHLPVSDFTLAEYVTFGLTSDLLAKVTDFKLLEASPFSYSQFEQQASLFYQSLPHHLPSHVPPSAWSGLSSPVNTSRTQEENVWRVHAYLGTQGCFHFCKKTCSSSPGACPGPLDHYQQQTDHSRLFTLMSFKSHHQAKQSSNTY